MEKLLQSQAATQPNSQQQGDITGADPILDETLEDEDGSESDGDLIGSADQDAAILAGIEQTTRDFRMTTHEDEDDEDVPANQEDYTPTCPKMDPRLSDGTEDLYPGAAAIDSRIRPTFELLAEAAISAGSGNIYHPFASFDEWSLAHWFHETGVSVARMDAFLRLPFVSQFDISLLTHLMYFFVL
jgi:hypothetical protein